MGYIYKITNTISGKSYIGETTKDPESRWKKHIYAINQDRGCPALRDAIQKYGKENFTFEVLVICFDDRVFDHEIYYIRKYNSLIPNGYNITPGGPSGCFTGHKHTKDSIEKIQENMKRAWKKKDEETKAQIYKKIGDTMKTKNIPELMKRSEKWQKWITDGVKNRHPSTFQKISDSLRKYYRDNEHTCSVEYIAKKRDIMANATGRSVTQLSTDDVVIQTFPSIAEAARQLNIHKNSIQQALKGNTRTGGGYKWKYGSI